MSVKSPTERDERLMEQAIAEAQQAINEGKAGVGAMLVWGDEVIVCTHNKFEETKDQINHAEIVALHKAAGRLAQLSDEEKAQLTMYTTLEPCLMCLSAMSIAGIKRVVYSALTEDANEEQVVVKGYSAPDVNPNLMRGEMELIPGVKREKGRSLLEQMDKTG